jgi:dCTP deaminase
MILTGSAIAGEVASGHIAIQPFDKRQLNPNSYNYRLGREVLEVCAEGSRYTHRVMPSEDARRVLLKRGRLYLATTEEQIGSTEYVCSLIGRSSIGRLGLFVQVAANLGHQGSFHRWTLELHPLLDIYVYFGQIIGQVSFWHVSGEAMPYRGAYGHCDEPLPSRCFASRPGNRK